MSSVDARILNYLTRDGGGGGRGRERFVSFPCRRRRAAEGGEEGGGGGEFEGGRLFLSKGYVGFFPTNPESEITVFDQEEVVYVDQGATLRHDTYIWVGTLKKRFVFCFVFVCFFDQNENFISSKVKFLNSHPISFFFPFLFPPAWLSLLSLVWTTPSNSSPKLYPETL